VSSGSDQGADDWQAAGINRTEILYRENWNKWGKQVPCTQLWSSLFSRTRNVSKMWKTWKQWTVSECTL
jgi:hypothetical protein